jgi:hypothetical protein
VSNTSMTSEHLDISKQAVNGLDNGLEEFNKLALTFGNG